MKSTSKLISGFESVVDNGRSHGIVVDFPKGQKGTDFGPTALELTVMGLSGCISTIFAVVASNSRLEYSGITVELDAHKPEGAKTIESVKGIVTVESGEEEPKVRRILDKTMESCPVGMLFEQAGVNIDIDLKVVEQAKVMNV